MDDLGDGIGKRIGGLGGCALAVSLLAVALMIVVSATPALGAKKDKPQEPQGPPPVIEWAKGDEYRMASTRMADRVTRILDAGADQAYADGSPAVDAPPWSDIEAVIVAPIQMPTKLLTKMAKDYPIGATGSFYGAQADWQAGDPGVFVAVKMAQKLPHDTDGQQVEIGLGGTGASSLQVGADADTRAGVKRFSLSGIFSNGAFGTGTTDVSGYQPGDAIEYYNADSGVFGFYLPNRSTWYLIMPRDDDTDSVVVSVRSSTPVGEVIDRLELPGGGHFVSLSDPTGGWEKQSGMPPLECRSLETLSAEGAALPDSGSTLIRYTAGMPVTADPDQVAALLQPAISSMGSVPVTVTAVGSQESMAVQGDLAVAPARNAVSLTFEAPAGEWTFALPDGTDLRTPAGETIIDHSSLTGAAGVRTGPGLDGLVSGDLSCAIDGSDASTSDAPGATPAEGATSTDDPPTGS